MSGEKSTEVLLYLLLHMFFLFFFFKTLSSRQKKREPFGLSAVTMVTKKLRN